MAKSSLEGIKLSEGSQLVSFDLSINKEKVLSIKQETIEEAAERLYSDKEYPMYGEIRRDGFINGAKWEQERSYSEEEAYKIWKAVQEYWKTSGASITFEELIEQFKKK